MTPTRFLSQAEKVDLVLDVLRANGLHESGCARWGSGLPCDCWLSERQWPPALNPTDLRVDVFRNNAGVGLRVTHLPTGITASGEGKSQSKVAAAVEQRLAELVAAAGVPPPADLEEPK